MKKVVALLGSRRKMNTYGLLVRIGEALAAEGAELEIVSLYDLRISDCTGCEQCIKKDVCPLGDDAGMLMEKLAAADGIILATPVYMRQISGKMKTFIDRTCRWYHRPQLCGKPVLCAATTKGSGLGKALDYLGDTVIQWGAVPAGRIGRSIRNVSQPVTRRELSRFAALLDDPGRYRPTIKAAANFEVQKALARFMSGPDSAYWEAMGWNDKPYYYPCRMGPAARLAGAAVSAALNKALSGRRPDPAQNCGRG